MSLLFLILASICNAVMDVCSYKFSKSVFNNSDIKFKLFGFPFKRFFDPSWRQLNKEKTFKLLFWTVKQPLQFCDGWHFPKMLMIGFIIIAIILYHPILTFTNIWILNRLMDFVLYSVAWNVTFNVFYDIYLIRKVEK